MNSDSPGTTGSAASVWDREASYYDAARQADPVYRSCIHLAAREIPKGTALCLDAGCGTGLSTIALSARCGTIVAVDYSLGSLQILKSKGLRNVMAVQADLRALPFKESVFGGCVCANTLQHFTPGGSQHRAVAELERVTRQNGVISVSVHHYSKSKRKDGWVKEGKPGQAGIDYIFRFTHDDLLTLLPGLPIRGVGYYKLLTIPFFGARLQNVLATLLGRIAARTGHSHMLIAVLSRRRPRAQKGSAVRR